MHRLLKSGLKSTISSQCRLNTAHHAPRLAKSPQLQAIRKTTTNTTPSLSVFPAPLNSHTHHFHNRPQPTSTPIQLPTKLNLARKVHLSLFGIFTPQAAAPLANHGNSTTDQQWLPADPSQLNYDPNNIHLDLSTKSNTQKYRILANGDRVPVNDPSETPFLTRVGAEIFGKSGEDKEAKDGVKDSESPSEKLQAELRLRVLSLYAMRLENDKARKLEEDEAPDVLDRLSAWSRSTFDYYFPSDFLEVLDITITQLERIFVITSSLLKGFVAGLAVTGLCGLDLWLFSRIYASMTFYPYIVTYFALSGYIFCNFIHLISVLMAEFPLIKEFIILFAQLHRLSTAPTYMIVKTVLKYVSNLNSSTAKPTTTTTTTTTSTKPENESESQAVLDSVVSAMGNIPIGVAIAGNDAISAEELQLSASIAEDANGNRHVDTQLQHVERKSGHSRTIHKTHLVTHPPQEETKKTDEDESILDQIQHAFDDIKTPTAFLQDLHHGIEEINEQAAAELHGTKWARPSQNDHHHVDIMVDKNLRITQDTQNDRTIVELSAPSPIFGSSLTVTTDKANVVLHG